jgi:GNAT superfamily N-acetyltransferase
MQNQQVEVYELTPERLGDLATVFGDRGDPSWCWCASFRLPSAEFHRDAEFNRSVLEESVRQTAKEDRAPGLVAYKDGQPVGWVSVGPRSDYVRLLHSRTLAPLDDVPVWSIVCFVVARQARGQGVGDALLNAATEYARTNRAEWIEAYPVDTGGSRIPSPNAYMGTLSMFERAGFTVVERRRARPDSIERPIVRKRLLP